MISLSLSLALSSAPHKLPLCWSPDLPPSLAPAQWAVQYITVKAASLSGMPGVKALLGKGSNQGHWPISVQRRLTLSLIRGLLSCQEPAETGSLKHACVFLPSTFPNLCSPSYFMSYLFMSFPTFFLSPRSISGQCRACSEATAAHGRRRKRGREGSRCLWQCGGSNEGPYNGKTISKAWTHRPLARTHAQNSEGVMGWQRPGGQPHWQTHIFTTHYMVNNEERDPPPLLSTTYWAG